MSLLEIRDLSVTFGGWRGAPPVEAVKHASFTRDRGETLALVGESDAESRLGAYPHQRSGGQRQRVMIAMAIANEPDILIADEPTTALDVTIQAQILNLMRDLRDRLGMALLLITHDLAIVRHMAERVCVMTQGEIVDQGATAEVFARPTHPYTRRLLAAEPKGQVAPADAARDAGGLPSPLFEPLAAPLDRADRRRRAAGTSPRRQRGRAAAADRNDAGRGRARPGSGRPLPA